mmetsp:Transcript_23388/g.59662  ORF Transcript_23388/g.59662 Transcript_23388/m.59662 type:complete len:568 (+) Transcript_23388:7-1710(+)
MALASSDAPALVMQDLAALVERAEALEAEGKFREAAELTAQAMTQAHADYVRSHLGSAQLAAPLQLPSPVLPMPRRSYVERYKARLRVDWQKWDRVSRRIIQVEGNGDSDEDDEGEPGDGAGADSQPSTMRAGHSNSMVSDTDDNPDEWKPETLAMQEGASGQVDLIHTTCGGERFVIVTVMRPDLPARAAYLFNRDAKATAKRLLHGDQAGEEGLSSGRTHTHAEFARWLLTAGKLSKNKVGDYLGRSDDDAKAVLQAFIDELDFSRLQFDEALRFFLSLFRLPGEAQQIDRIMQGFAERYHTTRPGLFTNADTAFILAFSVIMLNTDAHSAQIEHKMTLKQFLRNNQGIDNGTDLPEDMMTELYTSIVANEIRMEQREYIAANKEGWLLKQGGRFKSWKKRYTILSGSVLYYFKAVKDRSPTGFVPLEGIEVHAVPTKGIFELRPAKSETGAASKMKSARMDPSGKATFLQGHHSVFRFKVEGGAEHLDAWVRAVREHSVAKIERNTATSTKDVDAKRAGMSFFRSRAKPGGKLAAPAAMPPRVDEVANKASSLNLSSPRTGTSP